MALALGRPLVAIDLPGHGHSDGGPDGSLSITSNGADLARAVAALAPEAAGVVGMSLGGLSSIALAAQAPELVRALVLVDITPGVSPEKAAPITSFIDGPESFANFDELLARTMEHNPTRSEASLRRGILHNAVQRDDGSWVWRYARFRQGETGTRPEFGGLVGPSPRCGPPCCWCEAWPGRWWATRTWPSSCGASRPPPWWAWTGPGTASRGTGRWSWRPSCPASSFPRGGNRWSTVACGGRPRAPSGSTCSSSSSSPPSFALCVWQLRRALGGNGLSWAYVFEWPFFASYAVYMWWRFVHETPADAPAANGVPGDAAAATPDAGDPAAETPTAGPAADPDDEKVAAELAAYNAYLAELAARDEPRRAAEHVLVRSAVLSDLPAITDIANALIGSTTVEWSERPSTLRDRQAWFREHQLAGEPVLVAVDEGRVVGWAAYGDFRDSARWPGYRFTAEHSIHVAESHWGRGAGRALMVALVEAARDDSKRVLVAGIDGANVRSIAFHARLGFVEVARMPGVGDKWGQRLDLVLMQFDLSQPLA